MTIDLSRYAYKATKRSRDTIEDDPEPLKPRLIKRPRQWLGPLPPLLSTDLKIVFVGFNPGIESGKRGHYYAHPSNRFWKMLFWSGFTSTIHKCNDDVKLPDLYKIGFTDLVSRSTKGVQELTREEMLEGAQSLEERIAKVKPKVVCFVGKGIWESVAKVRGWDAKQFKYGVDPNHKFGDKSVLCCVPSTSGLVSIDAEKQLLFWKDVFDACIIY